MSEALASSYQKRKYIVLFGVVAILLICATWLLTIHARAEEERSGLMENYENMRKYVGTEIADGMLDSIGAIFGVEPKGTGKGHDSGIVPVNDYFRGVKDKIESRNEIKVATDIVKGFAMIMVLLYCFIELFKELQRGDGGLELWTRFFVIATISTICVVNYESIIAGIDELGKLMLQLFQQLLGEHNSSLETWISGDSTASPFWIGGDLEDVSFPYFPDAIYNLFFAANVVKMEAFLVIVLIAMEIPLMGARIMLLTLLIELVVRKVFFPLAMASVCTGGMRSPGVAYMKKLFGVYVRLSMCVLIALIGDVIVGELLVLNVGLLDGIMRGVCIFVVYTTCTKLFANTASLANQIVGAH